MVDRALPSGLHVRAVSDSDDAALGGLMERAYAGTIDEQLGDNSDGAIEVAAWRDESALVEVSVGIVDSNETVVAASLCSGNWDRGVWIAYVLTEPKWKEQVSPPWPSPSPSGGSERLRTSRSAPQSPTATRPLNGSSVPSGSSE